MSVSLACTFEPPIVKVPADMADDFVISNVNDSGVRLFQVRWLCC